jgi:hypothetical protein
VTDDRDDDEPTIALSCEPLLVNARGAACLCGVCERTWRKLDRCGLTPRSIAFGRRRLWVVATLRRWTEVGCPERSEFEMRARAG